MSRTDRIALVVVWFGPLPFWMPAFLLSCRHNPSVNWLIFSDAMPPPVVPSNVRFLAMDIDAFNGRATKALGAEIRLAPRYAYKLCDFKVMYGLLFEEELRGHDFWGCCDMDVVWGEIRRFLTPDILAGYDVITSRIGRVSGHFCLFRNRPEWATLFQRIPDVAGLAARGDQCMRIDELGMTELLQGYQSSVLRRFWTRGVLRLPVPRVYWDRVLTTSGKHQREMLANPSLRMRWRDGRTYGVHGEEMMYLHFHSIRKGMKQIDFGAGDSPREFAVSTEGIFCCGNPSSPIP